MKIERINDWFARQGRWMVQKRWLVLSLFILVFAIGFTGLRYFKVSASWENYFLEDDPMLVKTKEFKDIFGNDNFAAVLTQCDNSFMKENLELIRELTNEMMDSISYADFAHFRMVARMVSMQSVASVRVIDLGEISEPSGDTCSCSFSGKKY